MLQDLRNFRTLMILAAAAVISLEAASQAYSQRFSRADRPFRPSNVRSDVDADVYSHTTTRGGFNAYQGRRGTRPGASGFFDVRRDVVRPPSTRERYRASRERHEDRVDYDYGTKKYPSDHYSHAYTESFNAPSRVEGIPRIRRRYDDGGGRLRILTDVRRTRSDRVPRELVNDVELERASLNRSLAQTTIVEFRGVDGETILTNEPEKYRDNPAYVEVENHSRAAESSKGKTRQQ